MKSKKIKNITSITDYINLFQKIIQFNIINTIVTFKENNTTFYGTFENYKLKKQSLNKKLFNETDYKNNSVFNKCFKIDGLILRKYFGTKTENNKRIKIWSIISKEIKNDKNNPIKIYNKLIKNKKVIDQNTNTIRWENSFESCQRFVIKDEILETLFKDQNIIKQIIDLESDYYTEDERIAIKTFLKLRKSFDPEYKIFKSETIILNTQKETTMKTKTKRTSKIKQPKYNDIPEDDIKVNEDKLIPRLQEFIDKKYISLTFAKTFLQRINKSFNHLHEANGGTCTEDLFTQISKTARKNIVGYIIKNYKEQLEEDDYKVYIETYRQLAN